MGGYLDYAERGPEALKAFVRDDDSRDADSPFELHVGKALQAQGLEIRRQVGCGRFRVDLAVVDPKQPGRYVLGVECDGATYHSGQPCKHQRKHFPQIARPVATASDSGSIRPTGGWVGPNGERANGPVEA